MKNMSNIKDISTLIYVALIAIFTSCSVSESNKTNNKAQTQSSDYIKYVGPNNVSDFDNRYKNECTRNLCILQESPTMLPVQKNDGQPICVIPQYERQALISVNFDRDNNFVGANCEISKSEYDKVSAYYGTNNIFNEYLNQRDVYEDFVTWKTSFGFITTYKELIRRASNGETIYSYHLYIGKKEHPNYSEYLKR